MSSLPELRGLDPHHQAMILASGIAPEVALARGYRTVTKKADLERLGFSARQRIVPTLLVPIFGTNGDEPIAYQHRPDEPRRRDGKGIKYETPRGQRMVLDVPRSVRGDLDDPKKPLFVTEGARKADAGASAGLCTIALLGVWNWRGTNDKGGKLALSDWDDIALNDRDVFIVFDSDVMTKPNVHAALVRLKGFLEGRGAKVKVVYLPSSDNGSKVGLDDFLAAGHQTSELFQLASPNVRLPEGHPGDAKYGIDDRGCTVFFKATGDGEVIPQQLANFSARIEAEVVVDDALESRSFYEIKASVSGRELTISVPADAFCSMRWVGQNLGPEAILAAGLGTQDRMREAVQVLSPRPVPRRHAYAHLGWRKIDDDWAFIHQGGAIDAEGAIDDVETRLPDELARYRLPNPPCGTALIRLVRQVYESFDGLAPDKIMYPLIAAAARAAIGGTDLSLHIAGATGRGKSTLAVLACSFFGDFSQTEDLKVSWSSTGNYLEQLAFFAKDVVLAIDDFNPVGSATDVARAHKGADRVLRAQGNAAGRGRMSADGSLRQARYPRGLILSTGEEIPVGHSLRARMFIVEVADGDIELDAVRSVLQERGSRSAAMSGYVQYLAGRLESLRARLEGEVHQSRTTIFGFAKHKRTATNAAELLFGFDVFQEFAIASGAIDRSLAETHRRRCVEALCENLNVQAAAMESADQTRTFIRLVAAALHSGRAHLLDRRTGRCPDEPGVAEAIGWHRGVGDDANDWFPGGQKVGWVDIDEGSVFLQPDAAFQVVQKLAEGQPERIAVTCRTLQKNLRDCGLLKSHDGGRTTKKIRVGDVMVNTLEMQLGRFTGLIDSDPSADQKGEEEPDAEQLFPEGAATFPEPAEPAGTNEAPESAFLGSPVGGVLGVLAVPGTEDIGRPPSDGDAQGPPDVVGEADR